jgi:toxin ParE1/3/4
MAELIWTTPALDDLEQIAEYIARDNEAAARKLVQRVFNHVEQLAAHPESGGRIPEFKHAPYRQIIEPPCRVFYRCDGRRVFILHVMRSERLFSRSRVLQRDVESRTE